MALVLPVELLSRAFQHLPPRTFHTAIPLVCRRWRDASLSTFPENEGKPVLEVVVVLQPTTGCSVQRRFTFHPAFGSVTTASGVTLTTSGTITVRATITASTREGDLSEVNGHPTDMVKRHVACVRIESTGLTFETHYQALHRACYLAQQFRPPRMDVGQLILPAILANSRVFPSVSLVRSNSKLDNGLFIDLRIAFPSMLALRVLPPREHPPTRSDTEEDEAEEFAEMVGMWQHPSTAAGRLERVPLSDRMTLHSLRMDGVLLQTLVSYAALFPSLVELGDLVVSSELVSSRRPRRAVLPAAPFSTLKTLYIILDQDVFVPEEFIDDPDRCHLGGLADVLSWLAPNLVTLHLTTRMDSPIGPNHPSASTLARAWVPLFAGAPVSRFVMDEVDVRHPASDRELAFLSHYVREVGRVCREGGRRWTSLVDI